MAFIDNKDFILGEIEKSAKAEREALERSFEEETAQLEEAAKAALEAKLEQMRESQRARLERVKRQKTSNQALELKQIRLKAESALHEQIVSQMKRLLQEDKALAQELIEALVAKLPEQKYERIEVPSWVKVAGTKSVLDRFAIVGVVSEGETVEISEADILEQAKPAIRKRIGEAL